MTAAVTTATQLGPSQQHLPQPTTAHHGDHNSDSSTLPSRHQQALASTSGPPSQLESSLPFTNPPATAHGISRAMPTAMRAPSGASLTLTSAHPDAQPKLSTTHRPKTENGLHRRNSETHHKRPSSAPGDNPHDLAPRTANGLDARATQPTARPVKPPLLRARSEHPSARRDSSADSSNDEQTVVAAAEDFGTRHGFDGHYQSEDIISQLANGWYMYYTDKRHETSGKPRAEPFTIQDWRMRDRLKTVSAALAVCLNIGVEPPDQLKTNPGAKLEAWQDPTIPPVQKALENIGKALQTQYETLAIRTRYKQYLDPSVEETKKFCISLRRNAKDERVLLHYNGHGVPKPTASGELWVFNKNYTQYIPVSLYDLQSWLAAPTIFVWDCSEAGNIVNNFHRFADKHEREQQEMAARDPNHEMVNYKPYIHLAACAAKENLPTNPQLPADLFSSCLTTPIEMALWFFALQNPLKTDITPERAKKLPGRLQERRTALGELNWIFTAITDTIAWTTLPRHLFRKFFRQDLMVAALFRNFLLAQRIMSVYGCHPQSYPELPDTRQHPLWDSWDLAVDMALAQLPMLEREDEGFKYEYQSSTFFTDQLSAFDVYLTRGDAMSQKAPEQLPVVLQVLLSQQHRVRALILLGRFLDLGPWAVQLSLSIGIFPYVLKLLQSTHVELKPVMVFIWTRVLAVDISCQQDLIKDSGYMYFVHILKPTEVLCVTNSDEHKAMCAFILAMLCKDYKPGQVVCAQTDIMSYCLLYLQNKENPLLRQWSCLCLSQLWLNMPEAKWKGIREHAPTKLSALTKDPCCEVRAAMLVAMTTFIGIPELTAEVQRIEEAIAWTLLDMANDGSAMVRRELLVFLSHFVLRYESKFIVAAYEHLLEEKEYLLFPPKDDVFDRQNMLLHYARPAYRTSDGSIQPQAEGLSNNTVIAAAWKHIMIMSVDPHPEVQKDATIVTDYVHNALLHSAVGAQAQNLMEEIQRRTKRNFSKGQTAHQRSNTGVSVASDTSVPPSPGLLKRTFSTIFGQWSGADSTNTTPTHGHTQSLSRPGSLRNKTGLPDAPPEQNEQLMAPANYHVAEEPVSVGYEGRNMRETPTLPLPSGFLDWSIEYFWEPQMKANEAEEPGSEEYNARLWRRSRNEGILRETQPQKAHAGSHKWNHQLALINNGAQPAKMTFHQFEDHLAVADDANTIYVWDWKLQKRKSRFSNGNPEGSKISDIKFINEDDQAFLMSGSSDGVIRIYRNYAPDDDEAHLKKPELASAWRALTHMVASNINSGMVFDWLQVNGTVLVAGDVRTIRVWNASSETCVMDIPARSGSCVTSLTSDQMTGNMFVAGFGDGAVRVFDPRCKPQEAMVRKWKDEPDRQWVRSVHMQRGGQRELVSASRNGKVRLWDIRQDQPLKVFQTTKDVLRTASVHEHLPVFSVGTSAHIVKVFNFHGKELSRVEPYSSFLGQNRGSPISATSFHPHRMVMGAAARGDHHINLYTCTDEVAVGAHY